MHDEVRVGMHAAISSGQCCDGATALQRVLSIGVPRFEPSNEASALSESGPS